MKTRVKTPEGILHQQAVKAGYIPKKAFDQKVAAAQPTREEFEAIKRANPFPKFAVLSKKSLKVLKALRGRVLASKDAPHQPHSPSLPIDPRRSAETEGLIVVGSTEFGREFTCLIEFNAALKKFVLFYRARKDGTLDSAVRAAIARHLGHFAFYESDLRSGAIADTTLLEAGTPERTKAAHYGVSVLVPDDMLADDLEALGKKYGVSSSVIRFQAASQMAELPDEILPAKVTPIVPLPL